MSSQRYERVSINDDDDHTDAESQHSSHDRSPPPSFHSRTSSLGSARRRSDFENERLISDNDRTLADTFDSPSDDESDDGGSHSLDDRQRAMSGRPSEPSSNMGQITGNGRPRAVERRVTQLPVFAPPSSNKVYGGGNAVHDGVFANLNAKPERGGEDPEEKPPTYEQAAADATPPYWETTILAPGGSTSDDVFIDGLPVGTFFSFVWNAMISMSFQFIGFLITYLLHTTHAAKNGSKVGLGITLIQYGFKMKQDFSPGPKDSGPDDDSQEGFVQPPNDPNNHNVDPNAGSGGSGFKGGDGSSGPADGGGGMKASDWFAYALMLAGWFLLIKALSEYFKARRHENLVLQSPNRGLNIPVVAENERPENVV